MRIIIFAAVCLFSTPSLQQGQESFFAELFLNGNELDSGLYEGEVIGRRLFGGTQIPHGQGTIYYFTTDKYKRQNYTGEWVNGTREGNGTTHWRDGSTFKGEYKNGLEDGRGVLLYPNGDSLIGVFKEGKIHGQGVFRYANGNQRAGFFNENVLEGEVIFTSKTGQIKVEKWLNGKKVESSEETKPVGNSSPPRGQAVDNKISGQQPTGSETDTRLAFPTLWYDETHHIDRDSFDNREEDNETDLSFGKFTVPKRKEEERDSGPSLFSSTPSKAYTFDLASVLQIVKDWDKSRTITK